MKLIEALEVMKYGNDTELDLKVCYNNEFGEECTNCMTFVSNEAFKESRKYWAENRLVKYDYILPVEKVERYHDFEVTMLKAEGKNHFFILATNFH